MDIHPAILLSNRKIHEEADAIFYQSHDFDFNRNVVGAVPFLRNLSPTAGHNIKCITMKLVVLSGEDGGTFFGTRSTRFTGTKAVGAKLVPVLRRMYDCKIWPSVFMRRLRRSLRTLHGFKIWSRSREFRMFRSVKVLEDLWRHLPWIDENGLPVTQSDSSRDELMRARWRALLS